MSTVATQLIPDVVQTIHTFIGLEDYVRFDQAKALKSYDPTVHTWEWAIKNRFRHVFGFLYLYGMDTDYRQAFYCAAKHGWIEAMFEFKRHFRTLILDFGIGLKLAYENNQLHVLDFYLGCDCAHIIDTKQRNILVNYLIIENPENSGLFHAVINSVSKSNSQWMEDVLWFILAHEHYDFFFYILDHYKPTFSLFDCLVRAIELDRFDVFREIYRYQPHHDIDSLFQAVEFDDDEFLDELTEAMSFDSSDPIIRNFGN